MGIMKFNGSLFGSKIDVYDRFVMLSEKKNTKIDNDRTEKNATELKWNTKCGWKQVCNVRGVVSTFFTVVNALLKLDVCAKSTYKRRCMGGSLCFVFIFNKQAERMFLFHICILKWNNKIRMQTTVVSYVNEQLKNDMHAVNSRQEAPTWVVLLKRVVQSGEPCLVPYVCGFVCCLHVLSWFGLFDALCEMVVCHCDAA